MGLLPYAFASGFVLYVLWIAATRRWPIKFVVSNGHINFVRGIASAQRAKLEEFFLDDLSLCDKLTIHGRRESNGRVTISIKGTSDQGLKQRIRNYLLAEL